MIDLGTAITLLDKRTKHWRLQCVNSGDQRRYECQVWAAGKRFATNRRTALLAVTAAIERIEVLGTRNQLRIAEHAEYCSADRRA